MITFLVDTDVMVDFFRGVSQAVSLINKTYDTIALSVITEAELYAGVKDGKERQSLDAFLNLVPLIPVDRKIAKQAGLFRRDFGRATKIGMADALISATASINHLELLTLNTKHFPMISGLRPPYIKS